MRYYKIHAYVRHSVREKVEKRPLERGIDGFSFFRVKGVGDSKVAKLEVVSRDDHVHRIVEIVRENAYTGARGGGLIFVTSVEMAAKVRTGALGEAGL